MSIKTKRFKLEEVFPDRAADFARKLHLRKDDLLLVRKSYKSEKPEVNKKERSIISRISSFEVDRDGEVLDPTGLDQSSYRSNPVVLFGHDYKDPNHVIGKNAWIHLSDDRKSLIAKTVFAKHDFAESVYKAYTESVDGFGPLLNMWSVGFIPVDWIEKPKNIKGAKRLYRKWELLEYSAVPIGSNRNALSLSRSKNLITNEELIQDIEITLEPDIPTEEQVKDAFKVALNRPEIRPIFDEMIKSAIQRKEIPELSKDESKLILNAVLEELKKPQIVRMELVEKEIEIETDDEETEQITSKIDIVKEAKLAILKKMGKVILEGEEDEYFERYWPTEKSARGAEYKKKLAVVINSLMNL